jgi:hypothetical protein
MQSTVWRTRPTLCWMRSRRATASSASGSKVSVLVLVNSFEASD